MKLKCPRCNKGILKKGTTNFSEYGVNFGNYPADICTHCKEAWFDEDTSQKIENKSKRLGLFGIGRSVKADYRNGVLKIKFPNEFVKSFSLKPSSIKVKLNGKQLVTVRAEQKK